MVKGVGEDGPDWTGHTSLSPGPEERAPPSSSGHQAKSNPPQSQSQPSLRSQSPKPQAGAGAVSVRAPGEEPLARSVLCHPLVVPGDRRPSVFEAQLILRSTGRDPWSPSPRSCPAEPVQVQQPCPWAWRSPAPCWPCWAGCALSCAAPFPCGAFRPSSAAASSRRRSPGRACG